MATCQPYSFISCFYARETADRFLAEFSIHSPKHSTAGESWILGWLKNLVTAGWFLTPQAVTLQVSLQGSLLLCKGKFFPSFFRWVSEKWLIFLARLHVFWFVPIIWPHFFNFSFSPFSFSHIPPLRISTASGCPSLFLSNAARWQDPSF